MLSSSQQCQPLESAPTDSSDVADEENEAPNSNSISSILRPFVSRSTSPTKDVTNNVLTLTA